jgi:photosystem II stability/assembly factor-like uncharacterized protein
MLKFILLLVITSLNIQNVFSQNHFFENNKFERVNSDFNGSVSIGNTFLVYGNGGVIVRSTDRGVNWERINLNDSFNIVHIIKADSKLIGICSKNNIISSNDQGKTWEVSPLGTNLNFYQIKLKNNLFYILLKNKVWITDLKYKIIKEYTIQNDSLNPSFNITNNSLVYNAGSGNLGIINLQNDQQKIIEVSKIVSCSNCNITSKIKTNDIDLLYFALGRKLYEYNIVNDKINLTFTLAKSKGSGFDVFNNEIYYINSRNYPWGLDSISFLKFDSFNSNLLYIGKSKKDFYVRDLLFNDLNFISKDTIIATGQNNLIYISNDGGVNWELKSNLSNSFFKMFKFDSKNAVAVAQYGQFFYTENNGTTWLPQENFPAKIAIDDRFVYPGNYYGTAYFKDKNNGFISVSPEYVGDTNVIFTRDGGKTAKLAGKYDIQYRNMNSFALTTSNKYLYFNSGLVAKGVGTYTIVFSLDDTLGIIRKSNLKAIEFFYATTWKDNIYALAYDSLDANNIYSVFKSVDGGSNWTKEFTLDKEINFTPNNITFHENSFFANGTFKEVKGNDTSFIQKLFKIDLENKQVSNIFTGKVDGIWDLFKINNKYYFGTYSLLQGKYDIKLFYTENVNSTFVLWKENISQRFGATNILSVAKDSSFAIAIFDSISNNTAIYFVNSSSKSSVISDTEDQTYFYSYPPYPIPAMNEMKSLVYWDMSYNIDVSDIGVYDIYGNKIANKDKISINKLNSYSGYLNWDCSNVGTGVYMLQIKHGTNTHNIRAMVVR